MKNDSLYVNSHSSLLSSCAGLALSCSGILYTLWRVYSHHETKRIQHLAEEFARNGYVVISGLTASRKLHYWETVLGPTLQRFWYQRHPDSAFDITVPDTWPCPVGGKAYGDVFTEQVPGMPKLLSENYEAQAILVYFCSGHRLKTGITFGEQTHWRLKLLISPLWALGLTSEPGPISLDPSRERHACRLVGKEQSWHLVNWPAGKEEQREKGGSMVGCPIPRGAHIDSGENWAYGVHGVPPVYKHLPAEKTQVGEVEKGVETIQDPPPLEVYMSIPQASVACVPTKRLSSASSAAAAMTTLFIPQLAILFHCESPGDVTPMQGMTGFYSRSHLLFTAALHRALSHLNPDSSPPSYTEATPYVYKNLPLAAVSKAIKQWGDRPQSRASLFQPTLRDGQAILCCGALIHTSMRAQEPMCTQPHSNSLETCNSSMMVTPRVLQNLKVYFTSTEQLTESCDNFLSVFTSRRNSSFIGSRTMMKDIEGNEELYDYDNEAEEEEKEEEKCEDYSLAWRLVSDPWRMYCDLTKRGVEGGAERQEEDVQEVDFRARVTELADLFLDAYYEIE